MRLRRRQEGPDLDVRLAALAAAVEAAEGVLDPSTYAGARALLQRAGERLGHGLDHTVVALAGATGSGKSSLFNALAGIELSEVGVRRPTTSTTHACSWGRDATSLLDWLKIERRHHIADPAAGPDGLVLLDLPDHDSVEVEHRREVDRVVAVADLVVWVLDPQKYADRAIHEQYLRPFAAHVGVLLVALHQVDRLTPDDLDACRADLGRLLVDDGLGSIGVVASSVRTAHGLDGLRAALATRVRERELAVERLEADAEAAAAALSRHCGDTSKSSHAKLRDEVVSTLTDAAGVAQVTTAVAASYRSRAAAATGWPATRWLRKVRPDPLRRLHLGRGRDGAGAGGGGAPGHTSLPRPTSVTEARAETAVLTITDAASASLPAPWVDAMRAEVGRRSAGLPGRLDSAIASTDLGMDRPPRWWKLVDLLQALFFILAVTGFLWLAALFGFTYFQFDVETPEIRGFPAPTLLAGAGAAAGLVLALLARRLAAVGARRRARRARARLEESVRQVAQDEVFGPVDGVLARHRSYCEALASIGAGVARR